ncbi:MAG: TetR/AcrR family transcriptional regulator [Solirubrobacterales bacterium]
MDVKSPKAERSEATRAQLLAVARRLFGERGYADVGTEEIVRAAGVTRGALYHHFESKRELLAAVYEQVESELTEWIATEAFSGEDVPNDPLEALHRGAELFLDACLEPEVQRIVLLDAPSVLGWDRWREVASRFGLGLIQASLQSAIDAGSIPAQPVRPLAHVLMGALDEAAMLVARADDDGATRAEVGETLSRLIDALAAR